jgi:hypothetical protein
VLLGGARARRAHPDLGAGTQRPRRPLRAALHRRRHFVGERQRPAPGVPPGSRRHPPAANRRLHLTSTIHSRGRQRHFTRRGRLQLPVQIPRPTFATQ